MLSDTTLSADQARCAECGNVLPKADMIQFGSSWVCAQCKPMYLQRLQEGGRSPGYALWRSGKKLVMGREMQLPDRCVKCNKPTDGLSLKRNLSWHPPAYYLLIILSILIYVVVALIASKRAKIVIGLCEQHQRARVRAIITAWVIFAGALVLFICAAVFENGWLLFAAFLVLVGSIIFGLVYARTVYARRIDNDYIWLGGVCSEYLAGLPEWTGRK